MNDGMLVDDFLIVDGERAMHVCNAPSPAATASLEIGKAIADRVRDRLGTANEMRLSV
jgi:L-2-hydroxyglutarate oxidase